jgi:glutamate-ammonia-ligase adenylyltransferase
MPTEPDPRLVSLVEARGAPDPEAWPALAERPRAERLEPLRRRLKAVGLADAAALARILSRLVEVPELRAAEARLIDALRRTPSPVRALSALEGAVEGFVERRGHAGPLLVTPVLEAVLDLGGVSPRASRLMASDPALVLELGADRLRGEPAGELQASLQRATEGLLDTARFDRILRRFRNRSMLRIAVAELRGGDVRQTAAELADLADACLSAAYAHHRHRLEARHGRLEPDCPASIVAMGKLGGRELNFSSDVDVIYFYAHDEGGVGGRGPHELFVRLFERVTRSLSRVTEDGFVFRVDTDLRPEGRRGALANSLASAERYYQTWGRTWERAAWIRARPCAGDPALGAQILEMMRPFVYRRAFDLAAIEAIVGMKDQIDVDRKQRAVSSVRRGLDLKLGPGGIREIEFFTQALQLLHGGKDARLRARNTLEALHRLEAAGLVSARTAVVLADAYLALRQVEHRVQIVEDQQTHALPTDPETLEAVARSLGHRSGAELQVHLEARMRAAHELFRAVHGVARDEEPVPPEVRLVADPDADPEARRRVLDELGVRDPDAAVAAFDAAGRHAASPFHPRASGETAAVARAFVAELFQSPDADRALRHLPDLARALVHQPGLFGALARPALRRGVARVLGASDLLARILTTSPSLLPHVLAGSRLRPVALLASELADRLAAIGDDVEAGLDVLRAVKQEETLRTAVAELADEIDIVEVGRRMSALAELLIAAALELARGPVEARFGRLEDATAALVVVGGGSLGARELGYRTDLDLLFVYEGEGTTSGGRRGPVRAPELFTRLVQASLQNLTVRTTLGDLYPVDMRLRPSGSQGPLVTRLAQFERYHADAAQLWERQALVRSRVVAGPAELAARVDAAIARATYDAGPVPDAAARIREMRARMARARSRRPRPGERSLDLKLGPGGLVAVEFLVQHLLIAHGRDRPELRTPSTRLALERLAEAGLLDAAEAEALRTAYDRRRRVQAWLRVTHDEQLDALQLDHPSARGLALCVGYRGPEAVRHLAEDLEADGARIQEAFRAVLGE